MGDKDYIFCLHLGDQKTPNLLTSSFTQTRSFPDESSEAVFKRICNIPAPPCAPTTFPLLYDCAQLRVSFSSAVLTSKNENNPKKLCNTKGEGLTFYFFQRKVVRSTFITDALWQLQVCLYYPEMCMANMGESRKPHMDSSWHLWKHK